VRTSSQSYSLKYSVERVVSLASITDLSPTGFENLSFDIVRDMRFHSVQWRTPGADGGRDIEALREISDPTFGIYSEKWFIECKQYSASVNWPTVYEKIAHADALDADYLFLLVSSSASPQCLDRMKSWNDGHRRLKVRIWGQHEIMAHLELRRHILIKYGLCDHPEMKSNFSAIALELTKIISTVHATYSNKRDASRSLDYANAMSLCWSERARQVERLGHFYPLPKFTDGSHLEWLQEACTSSEDLTYGDNLFLSWLRFILDREIKFQMIDGIIFVTLNNDLESEMVQQAVSLNTVEYLSDGEIIIDGLEVRVEGRR
jgi:hypothetical protein